MQDTKTFETTLIETEGANAFTTKLNNIQAVRRTEPYTIYCSHCNLSFEDSVEFEHHNTEMHHQRKFHSCNQCNATFRRQDHLKRHIQSLHPNQKYCFICPVCGEDCARRDLLVKHIRKKHTSEYEVFKCRVCNFECTTLSGLEKHEIEHSVTDRQICPHCDTTFKRRDHMLRHVKTQHLNQIVSCPICGQGYKRKDHVARHVREKHQMGFLKGRLVKSSDLVES